MSLPNLWQTPGFQPKADQPRAEVLMMVRFPVQALEFQPKADRRRAGDLTQKEGFGRGVA